jgi:DNA-binding Lrp family transcriptional regulator
MKWNLDRIDFQIIALLQKNVQISNKELAASVNLAPSTCFARVQRLMSEGVLLGAHARVAPEALGVGLQAIVAMRLNHHDRKHMKEFWKHALNIPEVLAVYQVTGDKDFLVHMAIRDIQHLQEVAMDCFASRPEVSHIETSIIFEHVIKPVLPNLHKQP